MKKWIAMLMVLVLLMGCVPVLAATYTVDEKFWGQVQNQAVTGEIGFLVTGDTTTAMEDNLFQTMKQVLPQTDMTFGVTLYPKAPTGGYVRVKGADGSEKEVKFLLGDGVFALGGAAVAPENTFYLMDGATLWQDDDQLPGIFDILRMMESADEGWKERAGQCLTPYETMISVWMGDYAGATMGREGDVLYSELSCTIPAQAVKEQIKVMLHAFYTDTDTLALLAELLEGTGGEIYLNPAMESIFCMLVDSAKLTGDVQVVRRFDSQGALLQDSISLPLNDVELSCFPGVKWQKITLDMAGGDLTFSLQGAGQEQVQFAWNQQDENNFSGQFVLELPDEEGKMTHEGYAFSWVWQAMDETYTLQTDLCERLMQGTLTLTPDEKTDAPSQKISLDVRFTTTSGKRDPSYVEANLVWTDLQGDATMAVVLTAKTAKPFDMPALDSIENMLPFGTLSQEERATVLQQLVILPMDQAVTLPE